jgi:hypothetical protein
MTDERLITFKTAYSHIAVVEVHEKPQEQSTRSYQTDYGQLLFTAVIVGNSTKEIESRIGLLQQAVTHQGWSVKT